MDSSGIGIVLGRYKVVSKGGGRLRIINANRRVERILRMAGIFSIMRIGNRIVVPKEAFIRWVEQHTGAAE